MACLMAVQNSNDGRGIEWGELDDFNTAYFHLVFMWMVGFIVVMSQALYSRDSFRTKIDKNVQEMFPHSNNPNYNNYLRLPVRNKVN
jgi:hypothetical protein